MSKLLHGLLSDKLEQIAALYKVRPRITLIVRMPNRPDECAFLSDDAWPDAVATVQRLYGDPKAFKAGPAEPQPEEPAAPQPAPMTPEDDGRVPVAITRRADDRGTISFDGTTITTVRPCRDCGVLICGGPTRCLPCAAKLTPQPAPMPEAAREAAECARVALERLLEWQEAGGYGTPPYDSDDTRHALAVFAALDAAQKGKP